MTSFNGSPDIMTVSGKFFEFLNPQPEQIDINDIAHALSMKCRFAGHTLRFYSVAQHSVHVSYNCDPADALAGLLHDAAEAYLVDMPKPVKKFLPEYQMIEDRVQRAIFETFGLSTIEPSSVKRADARMLATEGRDVCAPGWEFWGLTEKPYDFHIVPMGQEWCRRKFLERFYQLRSDMGQVA